MIHRDYYNHNPLTRKNRQLGQASSEWVRSFDCTHLRPLIVCRGPVRKETMDTFRDMGIHDFGILLSEKDAIVYTHALAPELREIESKHVHRVPDYTGATKEERVVRIGQIIKIAKDNGYNAVFAGYGFMAEDESFVAAIENSGLIFVGPCSRTVRDAGRKDEAKRTAQSVGVSVTPGIDNLAARTLLAAHGDVDQLKALCQEHQLAVPAEAFEQELPDLAEVVLNASYDAGIDLFSIEDLCHQVVEEVAGMFRKYPKNRVRLKAIGGGGGKGQRILKAPSAFQGDMEQQIQAAASAAAPAAREVLNEVKAAGVGDNKNMLLELNIETTRHNEIQLIGNGTWSLALGGRDCSLQMHEQKLLEVSVTQEHLIAARESAEADGDSELAQSLADDLKVLKAMETESERFGCAVGLDNVSTFECIVDGDQHFFMEMNTRIQVEHRVTELCYALEFTNPEDDSDSFVVDALVEAMVLLACHKQRLPKPRRVPRMNNAVEARLNATDASLSPHAGGVIRFWSDPIKHEIRDDMGICVKNPDTGMFMRYRVAGAYDSNIALLITHGETREASYYRLGEILRKTKLRGDDLQTNLEFHYGLVLWFLGRSVHAKPTTRFIQPYLNLVGRLRQKSKLLDLSQAYRYLLERYSQSLQQAGEIEARLIPHYDEVLARKETLITRPLQKLLAAPHLFSGWLSIVRRDFEYAQDGSVVWHRNRWKTLADLYALLNMSYHKELPAAQMIWAEDQSTLQKGLTFYRELSEQLYMATCDTWDHVHTALAQRQAPAGVSPDNWATIRGAHLGFQAGLEMLDLLLQLARQVNFYDLDLKPDMTIHIPEDLADPALAASMKKVLAPPPMTKSDEIVAVTGGMFYLQEAPGLPHFVQPGDHFEKGQPIYIIEVMKMFNKIEAPFSGTVEEILLEGNGEIVSKGQALMKVKPDEAFVEEDPSARQKAMEATIQDLFAHVALAL